jgi:protein SCO1
MMRRFVLAIALAGLIAACGSSDALKGVSGSQLPRIDIKSEALTQVVSPATTQPFTPEASPHGLLIFYLGYTNCPDICPTTMSDIRTARQSLSTEQQKNVNAAFVTVDQTNDTPAVLLDYTHRFGFGATDHSVRPTDAQLSTLEKTLHAGTTTGEKTASGIQTINHTASTYVVNSNGVVVDEWDYGTPPADMAHDLKTLLKSA